MAYISIRWSQLSADILAIMRHTRTQTHTGHSPGPTPLLLIVLLHLLPSVFFPLPSSSSLIPKLCAISNKWRLKTRLAVATCSTLRFPPPQSDSRLYALTSRCVCICWYICVFMCVWFLSFFFLQHCIINQDHRNQGEEKEEGKEEKLLARSSMQEEWAGLLQGVGGAGQACLHWSGTGCAWCFLGRGKKVKKKKKEKQTREHSSGLSSVAPHHFRRDFSLFLISYFIPPTSSLLFLLSSRPCARPVLLICLFLTSSFSFWTP